MTSSRRAAPRSGQVIRAALLMGALAACGELSLDGALPPPDDGGGTGACADASIDASGSGGSVCSGGVLTCPANSAACGNPPACIDTTNNAAHCGGCDNACLNGQICKNSSCVCPSSMDPCGGVCTNPKTDPMNCGSCGVVCAANQACQGGGCK